LRTFRGGGREKNTEWRTTKKKNIAPAGLFLLKSDVGMGRQGRAGGGEASYPRSRKGGEEEVCLRKRAEGEVAPFERREYAFGGKKKGEICLGGERWYYLY